MTMHRNHRAAAATAFITALVVGACSDANSQAGGASNETQRLPVQVAVASPETAVITTPVAGTPTAVASVTYPDAFAVFRRGSYEEAAQLFGAYVIDHPDDAQGQYMLGLSAWKSGGHDVAERALQRAVDLDSGSVKARTNLARVLLEMAAPQEALVHIEVAVDLAPRSHEVWRVLGNVKSDLGRSDEALDAYRSALVRNSSDAWSMNNYGLVLIRLGRYDDALPALARAVEIAPESELFRRNLGVALERNGLAGEGDAAGGGVDLADVAQMFVELIASWRTEEVDHEC